MIVLALLLCTAGLAEVSPRIMTHDAFETDGEMHAFALEKGTYDYFPFTLSANCRLKLVVQCALEGNDVYIVHLNDRNMDSVDHVESHAGIIANPKVFNFVYDLAAGDYAVAVVPEGPNGKADYEGNVSIRGTFTPSAADDARQDDTFAVATEYDGTPTMGFLSSSWIASTRGFSLPADPQDLRDYYCLRSDGGNYTFNLTPVSPESEFRCTVYDEYYNALANKDDNLFTLELPAGNIYVMVEGDYYLAGDYLLRIQPE